MSLPCCVCAILVLQSSALSWLCVLLPEALEAQTQLFKMQWVLPRLGCSKILENPLCFFIICPLLSANYTLMCKSLFFWATRTQVCFSGILSLFTFLNYNIFFRFSLLRLNKKCLASSRQPMEREIRGDFNHKQVLRGRIIFITFYNLCPSNFPLQLFWCIPLIKTKLADIIEALTLCKIKVKTFKTDTDLPVISQMCVCESII